MDQHKGITSLEITHLSDDDWEIRFSEAMQRPSDEEENETTYHTEIMDSSDDERRTKSPEGFPRPSQDEQATP